MAKCMEMHALIEFGSPNGFRELFTYKNLRLVLFQEHDKYIIIF